MPRPGVVAALAAWAALLVGLLTWPLLGPGQLAARDMLVLDHPALTAAALGFGDLAARNVPQDGLLALVGTLLPASWFARVLIVAAAAGAAAGAAWLTAVVRHRAGVPVTALPIAAAMTVAVWNPFAVERLLQGHWSLVVAVWLLPAVAAAGLTGRPLPQGLLIFAASLTPTGGIFAAVTAVATARGRNRLIALAVGVVCCLPWVAAGLWAGAGATTSSAASVAAFAPRAEEHVGTLGALLGLGGIWNAAAVPASRTVGFALVGVVLVVILLLSARRCPPVLLALAGAGLGGAVAVWLLPGAVGWLVETVPGAGLIRDGQKLVALALPAYVALAGLARPVPAGLILALAILQVPDAPRAVQQIAPVQVAVDEGLVEFADGRDVFFPGRSGLITRADGMVVVDPATKALSVVQSGELVVDGVQVDAPSPRYEAAERAWATRDTETLAELGVGVVVDGGQVVETGAPARELPTAGVALLAWWLAIPLVLAGCGRCGSGERGSAGTFNGASL